MYAATSILATSPANPLKSSDARVALIKRLSGMLQARGHKAKLAQHMHFALTADELAQEEDFYVFDYGNAM